MLVWFSIGSGFVFKKQQQQQQQKTIWRRTKLNEVGTHTAVQIKSHSYRTREFGSSEALLGSVSASLDPRWNPIGEQNSSVSAASPSGD